jgi:hypothetical protein
MLREKRAQRRLLCAHLVTVEWENSVGRPRKSAALLEDISGSGAALQLQTRIEEGVEIRISAGDTRMAGIVRRCTYVWNAYCLGVEFLCKSWDPQVFEPEHLTDPETICAPKRQFEL